MSKLDAVLGLLFEKGVIAALGSAPGVALLGSVVVASGKPVVSGALATIRERLGQATPADVSDVAEAVERAYWVAALQVAAGYGADIGAPVTRAELLRRTRGWSATGGAAGVMSQSQHAVLRRLCAALLQNIEAAGEAAAAYDDPASAAADGQMEQLLQSGEIAPQLRKVLVDGVCEHVGRLYDSDEAESTGLREALERKLRDNWMDFFLGAVHASLRDDEKVRSLVYAELLADLKIGQSGQITQAQLETALDSFVQGLAAKIDDLAVSLDRHAEESRDGHTTTHKALSDIKGQIDNLGGSANRRRERKPVSISPEELERQSKIWLERLSKEVEIVNPLSIYRASRPAEFRIGEVYAPLHLERELDPDQLELAVSLREKVASHLRGSTTSREGRNAEHKPRLRVEAALLHPYVIIQGDAGSGKSTFLRCVAYDLCQPSGGKTALDLPQRPFPLYVKVSDLDVHMLKAWPRNSDDSPTMESDPDWIAHYFTCLDWGCTRDFFETKLACPDTVLLLDGLDEAQSDARRTLMAKLLVRASRDLKCRIVLSTRPQALQGEARPSGFREVRIGHLEDDDIVDFVERWCRCAYGEDQEKMVSKRDHLIGELQGQVRELARNPLMLSGLAVIHYNGGQLPESRVELYDLILEWLAKSREHVANQPHWETRLEHLRLLAFGMQTRADGRERTVELDEAAEYLKPMLERSAALRYLREVEADGGIVLLRGEAVEFAHLTFQEYLAAKQLDDEDERGIRETLLQDRRIFSQEWIMVLRFLVALRRKTGIKATNRIFRLLLDGAGETNADHMRALLLAESLRGELTRRDSNGNVTDFQIADVRFGGWTQQAVGLFEDPAFGAGLDARTRVAAAELWERLGDLSRIPLPNEDRYWVTAQDLTMGRYPVTVFEYEKFLEDSEFRKHVPFRWDEQRRFPYRPVTIVNWYDAVAYCEWASEKYGSGIRLASSEEWALVASGGGRREYPWGNEDPDEKRANFSISVGRVTPVGLFPLGNTPEGIADLAGNVWEWTSSDVEDGSNDKVLRGGSWSNRPRRLRVSLRNWLVPSNRNDDNGFRCLRERG